MFAFAVCSVGILNASPTFAFQSFPANQEFIINHYSRDNVLPTNTITDVLVSKRGRLFVASIEGLVVSDGLHWDVYDVTTQKELQSSRIHRIFEMQDGSIFVMDQLNYWYGFEYGRLSLIKDAETGKAISLISITDSIDGIVYLVSNEGVYRLEGQFAKQIGKIPFESKVWDLMATEDGLLLLTTNGLIQWDFEDFKTIPSPSTKHIDFSNYARFEKIGDHLMVVGEGGSECYHVKEKEWEYEESLSIKDDVEIFNIKLKGTVDYVVSTEKGLFRQKGKTLIPVTESSVGIRFESYFLVDGLEYYIGTDGVWVGERNIFAPEFEIVDASSDGKSLWVSTDGGLFQIHKNRFRNLSDKRIRNSYSVLPYENEGEYLVGSFDYGLSIVKGDQVNTTYTKENSVLPENTIRSLVELNNGEWLISVWGAAPLLFDGHGFRSAFNQSPYWTKTNVVEGIYEQDADHIWLGTLDGLLLSNGKDVSLFKDKNGRSLKGVGRIIPSVFNNELFFCTLKEGLVLFRDEEFFFLSELVGNHNQQVRDVYQMSEDSIWVATYESGLHRYVINDDLSQITYNVLNTNNGLPGVGFHRIIEWKGMMWISGNDGLLSVPLKSMNKSASEGSILEGLKIYREQEGLVDREFNGGSQSTGFKTETGEIYFTSQAGIVAFNADELRNQSRVEDPFYLRKVEYENETHEYIHSDTLEFIGSGTSINLEFATINLSDNNTGNIWYHTPQTGWQRPNSPGRIEGLEVSGTLSRISFSLSPELAPFKTFYIHRSRSLSGVYMYILIGFLMVGGFVFFRKRRKKATNFKSELPVEVENENADLNKILICIEASFQEADFNLDRLAEIVKMSKSKVYRVWKENREGSLNEYILTVRIEFALQLLKDGDLSITEIALKSGFSSQSYFSKVFKKVYGVSPSQYSEQV